MQCKEKCTLQWHSYSDHLKGALSEMMFSSEFADVTLVTDDKQQIRAHRNILGACSPVFKSILQIDSNNTNQVIFLMGIQHSEMESIMQFIYLGEARFNEERMSEFLTVSKNLEIKELSTGIKLNDQFETNENNVADENVDISGAPLHALHEDSAKVEPHAQTESITANNSVNRRVRRTQVVSGDAKFQCQDCERTFSGKSGLWFHTKSKHDGVRYKCKQCDKLFTDQSSMRRHIQSKHEGVKYGCNQCDQQFTQQSGLTRHIQSIHEGVMYACNQCDHQATDKGHLTTHIQSKHEGVIYPCNQCDYQATLQQQLTRHIQSKHEGVKYACNKCEYQATTPVNLSSHIQCIHEGVKYPCNQCDYQGSKAALRQHLKIKHF